MSAQITSTGLEFSYTDQAIMDYLGTHPGWRSAQEIAQGINEPCSHRLRTLLTNLTDRLYLESCGGKGYRIPEH